MSTSNNAATRPLRRSFNDIIERGSEVVIALHDIGGPGEQSSRQILPERPLIDKDFGPLL